MELVIDVIDSVTPNGVIAGLAEMLVDAVIGGASIGWTEPPTIGSATNWWRHHVATPGIVVWVARDSDSRVVGTVSLLGASKLNSLHRAEVMKLIVHREARGQGVSKKLMSALEAYASRHGRTLLVLDTETASLAETLYQKWGWTTFGIVDDYVSDEHGGFLPCSFMLKRLS